MIIVASCAMMAGQLSCSVRLICCRVDSGAPLRSKAR